MTEREIFTNLINLAKPSRDPRGAAAACVVLNGDILLSAVSSDDGKDHSETLLCKAIKNDGLIVTSEMTMYTTVEPCSSRSNPDNVKDDVSEIIRCGIKKIIFGVQSPVHAGTISRARMQDEGILLLQTQDENLVKEIADTFNQSVDQSRDDIDLKPTDIR